MIRQDFLLLLTVCSFVYSQSDPVGQSVVRNDEKPKRLVEIEEHTHLNPIDAEFHLNSTNLFHEEAEKYTRPHSEDPLIPIRRIDDTKVNCQKTHMIVVLKFSTPFNGYIYPYKHFTQCILFSGQNSREANLTLHHGSCAEKIILAANDAEFSPVIEHRLMIQWEREFVGEDDSSIIVRCDRPDDFNKTVTWNFPTQELASSASYLERNTHPGPRISMEIQRGEGPNAPPLNDQPVFLGDVLTIVFTVSDEVFWFGSNVLSCNAMDGGDTDENVEQIDKYAQFPPSYLGRMTVIENECSTKPKIFSHFFKESVTKDGSLVTLLYAHFKAFRFPLSQKIVLQCNVEVCFKKCDPLPSCSTGYQPRAAKREKRETEPYNSSEPQDSEFDTVVLYRTIEVYSAEDAALKEVPVTSVVTESTSLAKALTNCYSAQTFYTWIAVLSSVVFFLLIALIWYIKHKSHPKL